MADPMTREKLRDLLSDMECGAGPDGGDIMAACDDLIAQERAEVERLRADLAEVRRGKVEQMLGRLDDWSGDLATVVAERDRLAEQVKHTRDLLPEIEGTFRRLCGRLSTEDQEALAEVYMALLHNLGALDGTEGDQ